MCLYIYIDRYTYYICTCNYILIYSTLVHLKKKVYQKAMPQHQQQQHNIILIVINITLFNICTSNIYELPF